MSKIFGSKQATGVPLDLGVDQICIWIWVISTSSAAAGVIVFEHTKNRVLINDWRHIIPLHHNKTKVDKEGTSSTDCIKKFAILGRRLEYT